MKVSFRLNNKIVEIDTEPNRTLLDVIREEFSLTGTKKGCETGECGACTVLLNGRCVPSCLILIGNVEGKSITTIEGLAKEGELHPIQKAFVEKAAIHCGFCTPGMILAVKALLDENRKPSRDEIKDAISGNLCRCTGYEQIIEAVEAVDWEEK